jgi:alkylated DNA repair dioxygenase AlkB
MLFNSTISVFDYSEPDQGQVLYFPNFLGVDSQLIYSDYFLKNIDWEPDKVRIYDKIILTKRKIAWFSENEITYDYSGFSRKANSWDPKIYEIQQLILYRFETKFNSCLMNLYADGTESMSWHDDSSQLRPDSSVAIVSLGASRMIKFRAKQDKSKHHQVLLESGSLLLMSGKTQTFWQHQIPKMQTVKFSRISLTFRDIQIKGKPNF